MRQLGSHLKRERRRGKVSGSEMSQSKGRKVEKNLLNKILKKFGANFSAETADLSEYKGYIVLLLFCEREEKSFFSDMLSQSAVELLFPSGHKLLM